MNMKPSSSTFLFILHLTISLSLLQHSKGSDAVYHFCDEAAKRDPNFTRDFCVSTFQANPESQNIATLEELAAVSIDLATSNATNIVSLIKNLLNNKDIGEYTRGALNDCYELYSDATSRLHDVMDEFRSKDYVKANLDTSATMDASTTCEDGFKDKGGQGAVSPLSQENTCFFQLTAVVITFLSMLS